MKITEIAKRIGVLWGTLSESEKAPYQAQADADKYVVPALHILLPLWLLVFSFLSFSIHFLFPENATTMKWRSGS